MMRRDSLDYMRCIQALWIGDRTKAEAAGPDMPLDCTADDLYRRQDCRKAAKAEKVEACIALAVTETASEQNVVGCIASG